jgi:hypothetical protein
MISVLCVFNDLALFESMLQASVARQTAECELIAIDNTAGRFCSAADGLNSARARVSGDYVMCAHQDVSFDSPTWLAEAEQMLRGLPDVGVAGIAGAREHPGQTERTLLSNVTDSTPPQRRGHVAIQCAERVQSVDECLFFVPRSLFSATGLDEETCDGWHLYAVDYCLTVAAAGAHVYVLPLPAYHRSGGRRRTATSPQWERAYFRTLRKVLRKHAGEVSMLHTTCGTWSTRRPLMLQGNRISAIWRRIWGPG